MKKVKLLLLALSLFILTAFTYQGIERFTTIYVQTLRVTNAAEFNGTNTFSTGATFQSGLTVSDGNIITADFSQITAQTAISVTDGGIITPTGSYQPLESGAAVTATLAACGTAGRGLALVNTVTQTIIVSETATAALSGNATLGQYDALQLLCDGTRWVQLAPESDN